MATDWRGEYNWLKDLGKKFRYESFQKYLRMERQPVIIGGCGRSGTTLLLSILDAHPKIFGIPEETDIFAYERKFSNTLLNRFNARRKILREIVVRDIAGTPHRWCEKSPRNVRHFDQIRRELDHPLFINIVRDGRDVVTSYHPNSSGYHISIDRWVHDVGQGLLYENDTDVITIRYEDLILAFEPTLRRLMTFLSEEMDPAILNFFANTSIRSSNAWTGGAIKPLHTSSIGKWKLPEHAVVMEEFYQNEQALTLLKHYGYEV